jgi:hypothetical protein
MHHFEDLDEVHSSLQRLMQREPPLARVLPRQPGTKESRYIHLLSGDRADLGVASPHAPQVHSASHSHAADDGRLQALEDEVASLKKEVADLKQQVDSFRKQFE